jgi:hypothetical protein
MNVITNTHENADWVVIDTQSLLDWKLFQNPVTSSWTLPMPPAGWRWAATTAMRNELAHVLARDFALGRAAAPQSVLDFFDQHAHLVPAPELPAALGLHCTDPDDQKFIDLACAGGARWLISRDKAVLKLAKRARSACSVEIIPPCAWQPP